MNERTKQTLEKLTDLNKTVLGLLNAEEARDRALAELATVQHQLGELNAHLEAMRELHETDQARLADLTRSDVSAEECCKQYHGDWQFFDVILKQRYIHDMQLVISRVAASTRVRLTRERVEAGRKALAVLKRINRRTEWEDRVDIIHDCNAEGLDPEALR